MNSDLCGSKFFSRYRWFRAIFTAGLLFFKIGVATAQESSAAEVERLTKRVAELYQQGKIAEAIPLAQRIVEIRKRAVGENSPDYATSLNNLAELYVEQGNYAEAEPLLRRSLAIYEKALGPNHPDVAQTLNNLGELCRLQGRYAEAEPLFRRSWGLR